MLYISSRPGLFWCSQLIVKKGLSYLSLRLFVGKQWTQLRACGRCASGGVVGLAGAGKLRQQASKANTLVLSLKFLSIYSASSLNSTFFYSKR